MNGPPSEIGVIEHTVTGGTVIYGNRLCSGRLMHSSNNKHRRNTVNTRRTARQMNNLGVRLNEETGTVSTSRSRAAARLDSARTKAVSYHVGIR